VVECSMWQSVPSSGMILDRTVGVHKKNLSASSDCTLADLSDPAERSEREGGSVSVGSYGCSLEFPKCSL